MRRLLILLLSLVATLAATAAPAQADDPPPYGALYTDHYYWGSIYAAGPDATLKSESCFAGCYDYQRWKSVAKGTSPAGNKKIQLKSLLNGRCIDGNAARAGGAAWLRGCNTGNHQVWEVFRIGGDAFVFKSWGAFTARNEHLCLQATGNPGTVKLAVCNTRNDAQVWS